MKVCCAWALSLITLSTPDSGMTRQVLCQGSLHRESWKTHILRALSHLPDSFSYHHHCVNQGREPHAAVLAKHNMDKVSLCRGRLHTQPAAGRPLRNAFARCRFHAGYERVKRALGKHEEQYKYQRDLKAIVSFSQWLFKDSEYLDSFSFPVRNQRIFLEMFLLFRHLSNSGSL